MKAILSVKSDSTLISLKEGAVLREDVEDEEKGGDEGKERMASCHQSSSVILSEEMPEEVNQVLSPGQTG